MPRLNNRGPLGEGPMTGRRMGRCNPDNKGKTDDEILQSRDSSQQLGQGLGRRLRFGGGHSFGRGQGLGRGHGFGRGQGMGHGQGFGHGRGI